MLTTNRPNTCIYWNSVGFTFKLEGIKINPDMVVIEFLQLSVPLYSLHWPPA